MHLLSCKLNTGPIDLHFFKIFKPSAYPGYPTDQVPSYPGIQPGYPSYPPANNPYPPAGGLPYPVQPQQPHYPAPAPAYPQYASAPQQVGYPGIVPAPVALQPASAPGGIYPSSAPFAPAPLGYQPQQQQQQMEPVSSKMTVIQRPFHQISISQCRIFLLYVRLRRLIRELTQMFFIKQ